MSDFGDYQAAKDRREGAFQQYNYASQNLQNAQIHERLAEIKSQHQPLAALIGAEFSDEEYRKIRDKLYAAAFYVVIGRMP